MCVCVFACVWHVFVCVCVTAIDNKGKNKK